MFRPWRSPDFKIEHWSFWWFEMRCSEHNPIEGGQDYVSKIVYDNGYVFRLEGSLEIKRMFHTRAGQIRPDVMDQIATKYRQYINGLILGDPLMRDVTTGRAGRR